MENFLKEQREHIINTRYKHSMHNKLISQKFDICDIFTLKGGKVMIISNIIKYGGGKKVFKYIKNIM